MTKKKTTKKIVKKSSPKKNSKKQSTFKPTKKLLIGAAASLVIVGLLGIAPTLYFRWSGRGSGTLASGPIVSSQSTSPQPPPQTVVSGEPMKLTIPSLNFNLQVIPGVYDPKSATWTLTLDKAQFATPSVPANNASGNTLIYGHYRPEVFAYLHLITADSLATVTTSNGYNFTYRYVGTYALAPNNTSIFDYKGAPILTLQTCSGAFFQNRQMFQFDFVSYQKV